MTIPTENDNINQVVATGGEVSIAYDFKLLDQDHLQVVRTRGGIDATLVLSTDYTVNGVGNEGGGTITLAVAAVAGDVYTLSLEIPFTRTSDYSTGGDFFARTVNVELDAIIQMIQSVDRDKNRALRMAISDTFDAAQLLLPVNRASSILAFDASKVPYAAQAADFGLTVASAYIATLLDDADSAAARGTLELGGKWNLTATTNPGVSDDANSGYGVGSVWLNVSANLAWVCFDATVGAAVWFPSSLPVTTQGDIVYRGAAGLERLAIGATQSALRVVGGVPAWVSGDWEIIETLDAGGEAFQTFTADLSPYRRLWLDADNVLLNTSSDWPLVQVSQASSFLTTGYASHIHVSGSSSTAYSGGISVTNGWPMTGTAHATRKLGFDLHIHRPNDANEPLARWLSSHHSPSGLARIGVGGGNNATAAVINGLRITSASTITTGKFILKGIR